jgi:hypothetical protein
MADDTTARLALPLLQAGQAQKEMTHNEALARLDLLVQARVSTIGLDEPPAAPAAGDCWIVGTAPTGDWSGNAGAIAGWTADAWRFAAAQEGMAVWVADQSLVARYLAGAWVGGDLAGTQVSIEGVKVVGAQAAAVADPAGGTTIDAEARATIGAILAALRGHGLIAV